MRVIATLSFLFVSFSALGFCGNPNLPTAWHEFDLFGKEKLYISHLAAFHSIHAYQVIAEVSLDGESAEKFRAAGVARARLSPTAKGKTGATLQDRLEDWKLPDYMVAGKQFHAEITAGKETVAGDVTVTIRRVLHFQMEDEQVPRPKDLSYLVIGSAREAFALHAMTRFPDFDQVLAVTLRPGTELPPPKTVATPDGRYQIAAPAITLPGVPNDRAHALKVGDEAGEARVSAQLRLNDVPRDY